MTDKRKVGIMLAGDLYRRVKQLAEAEDRSVASWIARAVRHEIERIDSEAQ